MRNRRNTRSTNKIKEILTNKRFYQIVFALLCIIAISILIIGYRKYQDKQTLAKQKQELEQQTDEIFSTLGETTSNQTNTDDSTTQQSTTVNLAAVGDILCGTDMLSDANNGGTYDFSQMFSNVTSYTQNADIAIGTLETNFTDNEYSGVGKYNSPIEFLKSIKSTGIDLVSVAHNHEMDYGTTGFNTTIKNIEDNGISVTGKKSSDSTNTFTGNIKEVNGIKIAFLAYTYGLSNENDLTDDDKSNANLYSEEKAKQDIEYAKQNSNYIIAIMHWGDINNSSISTWQENVTNYLVDNGVDVILGSHPSIIEPMEIRKNQDGKNVLVAYSLGNYISSLKYENADVELILNIKIFKSGNSDKAALQKVDYTPIYVLDNGSKSDNRFELYNMKQLALDYTDGNNNKISKQIYNKLVSKLSWLDKLITKK